MSSRPWRDCIQDILNAVAEIRLFTAGMDFEHFRRDLKTLRAVEMNFVVIGEAASAVPDEVQEQYPAVPWHLMRGMRNRIAHAYFAVDEQIMWDTIQADLPALVAALETIPHSLSD